MKHLLISLAALIATTTSIAADNLLSERDIKTGEFLRDAVRNDNRAYAILESLTTEVGPRAAGSPGDTAAVKWAEAKFRSLGFDKVWTEPVTYPTWQRGVETAEVIAPFPQPLAITALGNSVATAKEGLSAAIVHFATLQDLEKADDNLVRGKIVFISRKMERFRDGSGYGPVVAARGRGASVAAKKGAVGFLLRSVGTDTDRLPHTGNMRYADESSKIPAAALSSPDADLLLNMLKRNVDITVKLTIGAQTGATFTSHNVMAEIRGSEKPDEYVLIGGHLDSWDLGTGALDDGAGCAMTMAAAEAIKRFGFKPKRSIRVVLFANEEQGIYGGQQYRDAHKNEIKKIIAAAESDFGAGPVYAFASKAKPESAPVVAQMASVLKPLGIEFVGNNASSGADVRAVHSDGVALFDLSLDGSDYFDYHHTANDTLDKVNAESLSQSTSAYAVFAWLAANAPGDFGFNNAPPSTR